MRLGIGSYTFGWAVGVTGHAPKAPLDEIGLLNKASAAGIKVVQIGDNLPLHTFAPERLDQLRNKALSLGIELQVGARRLTRERVEIYNRVANRLGAKLLRFVIDDAEYHPEPEVVVAVLRDCADLLDGLTLAIENHDRFAAVVLRDVIERAGVDHVGVCLDTANSLGAGEGLGTIVPTLAPLTVNLHIKDFRVERLKHMMGFMVEGVPAGKGMMRLPWILEQLRPVGRCDSAILEQWTPPEATVEESIAKEAAWASQSLEYLKTYFPSIPL